MHVDGSGVSLRVITLAYDQGDLEIIARVIDEGLHSCHGFLLDEVVS
jgi:hypothetical protein